MVTNLEGVYRREESSEPQNEKKRFAPEGWATNNAIASGAGVNGPVTKRIAEKYRETHPDWFRDHNIVDKGGNVYEHYHPDLVTKIHEEIESRPEPAPEGWVTNRALAQSLGVNDRMPKQISEKFRKVHSDWFGDYLGQTRITEHYHPDLVGKIREEIEGRPEPAPEGWLTNRAVSSLMKISKTVTEKIAKYYRQSHPDWFSEYLDSTHKVTEHYHPDLVVKIREEIDSRPEPAPEGWLTNGGLARECGVAYNTTLTIAEKERQSHPEWFFNYLDTTNNISEHYHPDLVVKIREEINSRPEPAPEGWLTNKALADSLGVTEKVTFRIVDRIKVARENPNWFENYLDGAHKPSEHFHPDLVVEVRKELENRPDPAPEDWMTNKDLERELLISQGFAKKMSGQFRKEHPEWYRDYFNKGNEVSEHYHPDLVAKIREEIESRPEHAPEGWVTNNALAKELNVDRTLTKSIANEFIIQDKGLVSDYVLDKINRVAQHYHPDLVTKIREKIANRPEPAPEGWITNRELADECGFSYEFVQKTARTFADEHLDWFAEYTGAGNRIFLHYHPNLVIKIKEVLEGSKTEVTNKSEILQESLQEVLHNPEELKNIQGLISLFGSAQTIDVLFALHPEYQGIPIEKVRSTLAEYLGDYLLTPAPLSFENLKSVEPFLDVTPLRGGLTEVIKRDALVTVLKNGYVRLEENGLEFMTYFAKLREKAKEIDNKDLDEIILFAEKFFISLVGIDTPKNIVDTLDKNREFPDLYQRINIREIELKRRLIISDEMGAGKSASAILAKEYLEVQTALILVPSNAINTWRGYLSDEVNEEGKQRGYFNEHPRVLVVENHEELTMVNSSDYDYVICSHERLTSEYTQALELLDYGMLIVDEVHKLKNLEKGVRAENLLRLATDSENEDKYVALLSGTPVPNKVGDVAMLFKLMYPERFAEKDNKELVRSIIHGDLLDIRQLLLPRLQMKSLGDHIEMPELGEDIDTVELKSAEEEIYQVLLDEDELTPTEKMQTLQKFLLNPKLLDITPEVPSSKLERLNLRLNETFSSKDKVVVFVNDYIEDVIRGEDNILEDLDLPSDINLRVVHGGVTQPERLSIQEEFQNTHGKYLLIVSGATADVAVDYSAGQEIIHYNEPWTVADKRQQQARVYRPGVREGITSVTSITKGTIEEGKHDYVEVKHRAIEKLLRGIPITELEIEILEKSESSEPDLSVNPELAEYYFSSFEKLNRIFAAVKEMGESKFGVFLERHGTEYADCYRELGSRSYQSNASRIVSTVIERMVEESELEKPKILDLASGPQMLWRHSSDKLRAGIVSMDVNPEHFKDRILPDKIVVGSFTEIPLPDNSQDFVNLSLALHYTKLVPSKNEFERLKVLREMSRVLKVGGRGVVNMIYSLDFKEPNALHEVASSLGLNVVEGYSGEVLSGDSYRSRIVTFEKADEPIAGLEEVIAKLDKNRLDALKLKRTDINLRNSRKVIDKFSIGEKEFIVELNEDDKLTAAEEVQVSNLVSELKSEFGSIKEIPRETVIENGFVRIKTGKNKYILYKKLPKSGVVVIR